MRTKKVKVYFDKKYSDREAKYIPIWNLNSELRKSKCDSVIPGGKTQYIPL